MRNLPSCTAAKIILRRTIDPYISNSILELLQEKGLKNMLLSIIRFFQSWRRYGTAMAELSQLNDRELADIGITRGDIARIAWEHADQARYARQTAQSVPPGTAFSADR